MKKKLQKKTEKMSKKGKKLNKQPNSIWEKPKLRKSYKKQLHKEKSRNLFEYPG